MDAKQQVLNYLSANYPAIYEALKDVHPNFVETENGTQVKFEYQPKAEGKTRVVTYLVNPSNVSASVQLIRID